MELDELIAYARNRYAIEEQHKWQEFPGFSVLSHPQTGKWIALLMRQWDTDRGREFHGRGKGGDRVSRISFRPHHGARERIETAEERQRQQQSRGCRKAAQRRDRGFPLPDPGPGQRPGEAPRLHRGRICPQHRERIPGHGAAPTRQCQTHGRREGPPAPAGDAAPL